jgi:hypothetical protein
MLLGVFEIRKFVEGWDLQPLTYTSRVRQLDNLLVTATKKIAGKEAMNYERTNVISGPQSRFKTSLCCLSPVCPWIRKRMLRQEFDFGPVFGCASSSSISPLKYQSSLRIMALLNIGLHI